MKRNSTYSFTALLALTLIIGSCKKDSCSAGGGGDLTLKLTTKHHTRAINGCTVKVKFNATEFPGEDGAYDITVQANSNESFVTLEGLKCGDYYFYGVGVDSSLSSTDKTVKGGVPFSTEQETGTIEVLVPVTEAH